MEKEKSETRNLNVTLQAKNDDDDTALSFSIVSIVKYLKKYFLRWLVLAFIIGGLVVGFNIFAKSTSITPVDTLVSFSYPGIEKGKNPDDTDFDGNELKSPTIISNALEQLGLDPILLQEVRANLIVMQILPTDTMDRFTVYDSIYKNGTNSSLNAAQAILEETWYPTQFKLEFDYRNTSFDRKTATLLLNTMAEYYRTHFFKKYGVNEPLGNRLSKIQYTDYDYAEALDVFEDSLNTMKSYVNEIALMDSTRFRSSDTGYTFADLGAAISSIKNTDLDILASYITVNNVTKDKDTLASYYQYRIEALERSKIIAEEKLAAITDSINSYVKDQIIIFGNGTDGTNTQYTQASAEYDKLINAKISTQEDLSTCIQRINYYNNRVIALKTNAVGSTDKVAKTEKDLGAINAKILELVQDIDNTATDYYVNYSLKNAYNILVPANYSLSTSIQNGVFSSIIPTIALELLLIVGFFAAAVIAAIAENVKKTENEKVAEKQSNDNRKSTAKE